MKFPFILRSDHEKVVRFQGVIIKDREATIESQRTIIFQHEAEIESLVRQLTEQQTAKPAIAREKKPFKPAKMSYRSLAQARSQSTIKPPADSAAQLEERVKKEGGVA